MTNSRFLNNKTHKLYLVALLISVLFAGGCASKKSAVVQKDSPEKTGGSVKISQPRVFSPTYKSGLYKADMQIHGRNLSGLMFFNKKDSSLRMVMLSEVGLKYFDVEYSPNGRSRFVVHQMIDFLDHEKFTGSLQNFLNLVMLDANEAKQDYTFECQPRNMVRVIKKDGKNNRYYYNSNSGAVNEIIQSGFLKKKITIELTGYDYLSPGKIIYNQGKIHYSLTKVERE